MALPQFIPPYAPSTGGTTVEVGIRARMLRFGDGYSQRAEDGINTRPRSGTWSWSMLEQEQVDAMIVFLSTNAVTGFVYAVPGDVERKYRVEGKLQLGFPSGNLRSLSFQVEEIFDP